MRARDWLAAIAVTTLFAVPAMAQTSPTDPQSGHHYSGGPKTEVPHHMGKKEDLGSKDTLGDSHHYSGGPKTEVPHHMGPKKKKKNTQ